MSHTDTPRLAPARIEEVDSEYIRVAVEWMPQDGLDRLDCSAYGLRNTPAHRQLAERLRKAIDAGVVITPSEPYTDVNGARGWHTRSHILARTMNADLTRLGF